MSGSRLKWLRVAAALMVFSGLTAALADFRTALPAGVGHTLASLQLVPSLVALATGAALSVAGLVMLVLTVVAGRVYCSAVCPLGILQDIIARLSSPLSRRRPVRRYARPSRWLRPIVFWLTVGAIAAGWGGFALALVDPYSNYGRIATDLFRPLISQINNAGVGIAHAPVIGGLYRVDIRWAGIAPLLAPLLLLALLVALVVWQGRLYCNTLCPVGTLLGWLARRAAFRLTIDGNACTKCADCLHVCKAHCIDLRHSSIDFSRCVACYNCLGACREGGIGYRPAWRHPEKKQPIRTVPRAATGSVPDSQRRAFLAEVAVVAALATRAPSLVAQMRKPEGSGPAATPEISGASCPPGAVNVDRYLDRCTACHLCIAVCPTRVLQPAFLELGLEGVLRPRLDFTRASCAYTCQACGEACPTGAIGRLDLPEKQLTKIGEARLDVDQCIVKTKGTDCAACSEQCPTQAVFTEPFGNNLRLPHLDTGLCIGCGACEFACPTQPTKAITVAGFRDHGRARKPAEKKAKAPVPTGDFPF